MLQTSLRSIINQFTMAKSLLLLIATLCLQHVANAVYYLAEPDKWRCFKDTVVNNYVSYTLRPNQ
jgi:hypothetical protein